MNMTCLCQYLPGQAQEGQVVHKLECVVAMENKLIGMSLYFNFLTLCGVLSKPLAEFKLVKTL